MKKLIGIMMIALVTMLISVTAFAADETESEYDFNYNYTDEGYYPEEVDYDYDSYNETGFVPDYSDLYYDEYQAAWYAPAMINDWADFYSFSGEYICSIPAGSYVQPLESIGRSGDITYVAYGGYEGYVYTVFLLTPSYEVTYDEINQSGEGIVFQLLVDANLRDEYGNYITTIPAGYGVEVISYDDVNGRCGVRWNGLFGSIIASAIWFDPDCYYVDDEDDDIYYDDDVSYYDDCTGYYSENVTGDDGIDYYDECYGYAMVKPAIGANMRDNENNLVVAIPCGEKVKLLEPQNIGGRTLVKWDKYVGTVLTSCLLVAK